MRLHANIHRTRTEGKGMGMVVAGRPRFVLVCSIVGVLGVLLVALLVGAPSRAEQPPTTSQKLAAPLSGDGDIASLRTERSRTYRRSDGSYTKQIALDPMNYRDAHGDWQLIDPTLRRTATGLTTSGTAVGIMLPDSLRDPVKVSHGDDWVSFDLAGAQVAPSPTIQGETATYADVLDGVDADYTAQAEGLKETLTLADPGAPSTYRFALHTNAGLEPEIEDDGSLVFRDGGADHAVRFTVPAPTVQAAGEAAPSTGHANYRLADDGDTLVVTIDQDWLASARFPVRLDPTIWRGGGPSCTLASGALATTQDCDNTYLKVGHDATHVYRAALRFTGINDDVPRTASIISARLSLTFPSQSAGSAVTPVDAIGLAHPLTDHAT
jgi:hypothetical protein